MLIRNSLLHVCQYAVTTSYVLTPWLLPTALWDGYFVIIIPILQMRKPRLREIICPRSHCWSQQSWDPNQGSLAQSLYTQLLHCTASLQIGPQMAEWEGCSSQPQRLEQTGYVLEMLPGWGHCVSGQKGSPAKAWLGDLSFIHKQLRGTPDHHWVLPAASHPGGTGQSAWQSSLVAHQCWPLSLRFGICTWHRWCFFRPLWLITSGTPLPWASQQASVHLL